MTNDNFIKKSLEALTIGVMFAGTIALMALPFDFRKKDPENSYHESCTEIIPSNANLNIVPVSPQNNGCDRIRVEGEHGEFYGFIIPKKPSERKPSEYCDNPFMTQNPDGSCDFYTRE